ncbi:MAG: hypothetical protein MPK62_02285 [Alphaproteobacteria bacterium]|nr:hypothetical protein [Alphaproteobacteria bacterium]MDA8029963.1 hypothetical protein [Alphaproteobacteria bacterium]
MIENVVQDVAENLDWILTVAGLGAGAMAVVYNQEKKHGVLMLGGAIALIMGIALAKAYYGLETQTIPMAILMTIAWIVSVQAVFNITDKDGGITWESIKAAV